MISTIGSRGSQAQDMLTRRTGAYLSVLSAFNQSPGRIRVSVAAYPFLDFVDPWYHQAFEKPMFGLPQLPAETVTKHLKYGEQGL